MKDRLKIFTWHIHGTYLYYLSQGNYDIYIPADTSGEEGYCGRGETFPFGKNVITIPTEEVARHHFDCILYQTKRNYLYDRTRILSRSQSEQPCVYLEHDPPWNDPTDSPHPFVEENGVLVHVTHFNKLMWLNRNPNVKVIEHGVVPQPYTYTGELDRGIVVINHLHQRGRKLGADIYEQVKKSVSVDLIGMGTSDFGGNGEILHPHLPGFLSKYRFFFNPIRYTSLGLSFCEAMMLGLPVVALATTEYSTIITDGESGFLSCDTESLVRKMKLLLENQSLAREMGVRARETALQRFDINRFTREWEKTFEQVANMNKGHYETSNSIYQ
jgi:hypothetical protein